jgi:HEPN domain-containing protein
VNLRTLAEDYLRRAEVRVESAKNALTTRDYPDVIRFSQEGVELSLKAALRAFGVEYAKEHDVSEVLRSVSKRFPLWFRQELDYFANVSADLASKRAVAMYGLELEGKGPSQIFGEDDASRAFEDAKKVLRAVKRLVKE